MIHKQVIEVWTKSNSVSLHDFVEGIREMIDDAELTGTAFLASTRIYQTLDEARQNGGLDRETEEILEETAE